MNPKPSIQNVEITNNYPSKKKIRIRKLTPKQWYRIFIILLGSTVIALNNFIMLMSETEYFQYGYQWVLSLGGDFFLPVLLVLFSSLVLEFTLLGGFCKNTRHKIILTLAFSKLVVTLFWAIFQLFTEAGIIVYTVLIGLSLAYSGFVGIQFFETTQKNAFNLVEQGVFPILTSGLFIVLIQQQEWLNDGIFGAGVFFVLILLSLVIAVLLNYKKPAKFRKLLLQYILVISILAIWFVFISFTFLYSYMFRNSGVPFDSHSLFLFPYLAIVGGTFFLWDNILQQISKARLPPNQPSQSQNKFAVPQITYSDYNNNNGHRLICPNCDVLLEQDAIQELKVKKTVFCALCGSQISFLDIFREEKATILEDHQRLMEKITNLPSRKADHSKE